MRSNGQFGLATRNRHGRKHRALVIGVIVALIIVGVLLYITRDNDPVYQGTRLSQHLEAFRDSGLHMFGIEQPVEPAVIVFCADTQAVDAVARVGAEALPLLVHLLQARRSPFRVWISSLGDRFPFLRKYVALRPSVAGARQIGAIVAFHYLGLRAAPAIPKLVPLLSGSEYAVPAVFAIVAIRPEREQDVLTLTNALRNARGAPEIEPGLLHSVALLALSTFGHKASGAIPVVMPYLKSTNEMLRAAAATALVRIGDSPEAIALLITKNLPQTNPPVYIPMPPRPGPGPADITPVLMNLWALGECGNHARMALPIITNLYSYPVDNVQRAARKAAAKITADTFR